MIEQVASAVPAVVTEWRPLLDLLNNLVVPLLLYLTAQVQKLKERMVRVETLLDPNANTQEK